MQPISHHDSTELEALFIKIQPSIPYWSLDKFLDELVHSSGVSLRESGQIAAFILFRSLPDADEVILLGVDPTHHRKGLMKRLFSEWVGGRKKNVWLEVHEKNTAALNLYKNLGFREDGRRERYYPDGGAAVTMSYHPNI